MKAGKKLHKYDAGFYFRDDDDICYDIESHLQYMIENNIEQMKVFLAKRVINSEYFYCNYFFEVGEKSEGGCGKICQAYIPRNGKSGACKFTGYVYERSDEYIILKIDKIELTQKEG